MIHQHPGGLTLTSRLLDYCAFNSGAKVLDVGCGIGTTVEYLCNVRGLNAIGTDVSELRLAQAKKRAPCLQFVKAAGESLPFADGSFDGLIAECSLSVMQDTSTVLAEFSRVLVPGGKLAITDIYLPDSGCLPGFENSGQIKKMVAENGFTIVIWEDQSACLREFVACYIMEYGSVEELWRCRANLKTKLGYFLLVAEKMANERMNCCGKQNLSSLY